MSTIVVVDDDQVFSGLLKTVLEMEGYQVELVPNPDEVVPEVRRVEPALVLMDVHTGPEDTLGVMRELRSEEGLRSVPVVMTSGMERSAECLDAGADRFMLKPFRPDELVDLVAELIDQ